MFSVLSCTAELDEIGNRPVLNMANCLWPDSGGHSGEAQYAQDGQWHEVGVAWSWSPEDWMRIAGRCYYSYL